MRRRVGGALLVAILALGGCVRSPVAGPAPVVKPTDQSPPLPPLLHIHMFSATTGWGYSRHSVYRTTTGGRSWHKAWTVHPGGQVITSDFAQPSTAWVAVSYPAGAQAHRGQLVRTTDGGRRWATSDLPSVPVDTQGGIDVGGWSVGNIAFLNSRQGWLLTNVGWAGPQDTVWIYRTGNGGVTWTRVMWETGDSSSPGAIPFSGYKAALVASSATTLWIPAADAARGYLYVSRDGGRTWGQASLPAPSDLPLGATLIEAGKPTFFGAAGVVTTLWANVRSAAGQGAAVVYHTTNGGLTWSPEAPPLKGGSSHSDFISPMIGWNFVPWTPGDALWRTTDGGASWTRRHWPAPLNSQDQLDPDFVSPTLGFLLAIQPGRGSITSTLFITTGAGRSWTEQAPRP